MDALHGVGLGGARGAAAAVPAGAAAQQNHLIARGGALPADILGRGGGDDRADLHALGGVAGVVELIHHARGQADLVSVGAVARGGGGDDLPLGELAGEGLGEGLQGVCRAGHAHGGVDIRPTRQGIADGAADAGGRAAEGLDLRGVVVGFVFKEQQPGLRLAVHLHSHLHGAGVDLLGFIELAELSGVL